MLFEWARLESFHSAPTTLDASAIRLASAGFFYTGGGHNCRCTFCGLVYHNWQNGDDPYIIHRRFRPQCPFVVSEFNAVNIPIKELERITSPAFSTGTVVDRTPVTHNGYVSTFQPSGNADGDTDTRIPGFTQKLLRYVEGFHNQRQCSNLGEQIAEVEQRSNIDTYHQTRTMTESHTTLSTEGQEQSLQNAEILASQQDNSTNILEAKYPEYMHLWMRRDSFTNWPPNRNFVSPFDLADCGFFYTGNGDNVRCFHCGFELCKFEPEDNPWIEHAKWSSECLHILYSRGPEFIKAVQMSEGRKVQIACLTKQETAENQSRENEFDPNSRCSSTQSLYSSSSSDFPKPNGFAASSTSKSRENEFDPNSRCSSTQSLYSSSSSDFPKPNGFAASSTSKGRETGFGSTGSLFSSNKSIYSTSSSDLTEALLPGLTEKSEFNHQKETGCAHSTSRNMKTNNTRARFPEYIYIERRMATFKNWPTHQNFLQPQDLSECGFFYANFDDCVRCFHCGIGLHNWEVDDNPWVEHARWSRKCPYVLHKKGQEFVDSVLTIHGILTDEELEREKANAAVSLQSEGLEETRELDSKHDSSDVCESQNTASSHATVNTDHKNNGEEILSTDVEMQAELLQEFTCKFCHEERVGITFLPCGHLVTCLNCFPKVRRCPLCRCFIRSGIKTTV